MKRIFLVLGAVVVIFAAYVATRPGEYKVERSLVVNAPASEIFPRVATFQKWTRWSPWANLDPSMRVEYSGPKGGVGSVYSWKGNDKVGEGRMTVTGAVQDQLVEIRLEFIKPWEQTSKTSFTFRPEGPGTRVTWSMTGERDFVGKLFGLFMDMDKMVGPDFEKGLAALRDKADE
jgi:hypothetical protein